MGFRVEEFPLSDFLDHTFEVVDRVGSTMPADFNSVDDIVSWVDSAGEDMLKDIFAWEPQLAEVIVMPKRRSKR